MKADKANGAKFALYNAVEDYNRMIQKTASEEIQPQHAALSEARYVVAIGESQPPEIETLYAAAAGTETRNPLNALDFDSYGDALKWAVDNCEYSSIGIFAPRGYERPKFPRVCYLRVFCEVESL